MQDDWTGFADLLANMIEKYASQIGIEDLPEPIREDTLQCAGSDGQNVTTKEILQAA